MSNNLDLSQVAEAQNQKFQTINDKGGQLDAALTESFEADVSAGNVTLSSTEYRRAALVYATGAATGGRTVTLPAIKKWALLANFSTTHSVSFVRGSTSISVPAGTGAVNPGTSIAYTDGTTNGLFAMAGAGIIGAVADFTDLGDVPGSYATHGLKLVRVDAGATALEFVAPVLTLNGDFPNSYSTHGGKQLVVNAGATAVEFVARPYDFGFAKAETPDVDEVLGKVVIPRAMSLPDDFAGARGHIDTNPTATFDIDVTKNGSSVGTISIDTGGVFTFTTSGGAVSLAAGDVIRFVAPNPADATAAGISATLVGSLT
jgi:hypothetical protein